LALLLALVVKEPPAARTAQAAAPAGSWIGLRRLWTIRPYRGVVIGAALHLIAASALNQWIAAYLMRAFALSPRDVGVPVGLLVGVAGGLATIAGGMIADRFGKSRPEWLAWLPAIAMAVGAPFALAVLVAPSFKLALMLLIVPAISTTAYTSPLLAGVQFLAPAGSRTAAAGLMMLVGGIVGQALGPLLVGILSDQFASLAGVGASLRWSLAAVLPASFIGAAVLWKAGYEIRNLSSGVVQPAALGGV
jgi:MFS family permease